MSRQVLTGWLAAFLFAALFPTIVLGAASGSAAATLWVFGVTLGLTVVVALPAFLFLRSRGYANLLSSMIVGFVIGAVSVGIMMSGDGEPLRLLVFLLLPGALGAISGMVFSLVLKAAEAGDAPDGREVAVSANGLAFVAVLISAIVLVTPFMPDGRRCHYAVQDGYMSCRVQ